MLHTMAAELGVIWIKQIFTKGEQLAQEWNFGFGAGDYPNFELGLVVGIWIELGMENWDLIGCGVSSVI